MKFRRSRGRDQGDSARDWVHRGDELLDSDLGEAEQCYRQALTLDDSLDAAWFDLGLIHKWRGEWQQCLDCNRRAVELSGAGPGSEDPGYWNAGIAATALGYWDDARWAWRGYGVPIGDGTGEIEEDFGPGVVRLPDGETVWGLRIDPSRMRLMSVPLPSAGFRCGDIVLHDGSPEGVRVSQGREYSVFDVLARLTPSDLPTVELLIDASDTDVETLIDHLSSHDGFTVENWTQSVVAHCAACSRGRVDYGDPDHDHPQPEYAGYTRLGCSGHPSVVEEVASQWQATTDGVVQRTTVHD